MKNKKLWIITELFSPDQTSTAYILKEISAFLSSRFEVEVICGPANYDKISNSEFVNVPGSIKISRIKSPKLDKNNLLLRSVRLILISIQLIIVYLKKSKKDESVLIITNPAPLLLLFAAIARFSKRKINILIHDVFPENTIPAKIIRTENSFIYKILKKIFDYAYSQFDTLIVLGRDMQSVINKKIIPNKRKNNSIVIIENWADIDEVFPIKVHNYAMEKWGLSDKFIFLFAGNLGRSQALDDLSYIIKKVKNPLLHFVFLGDGAFKQELLKVVKENNLNNVTIGDSFSRSMQCLFLNASNAGLVTLAKGMAGLGVPSKSYNIMASGKPILYFGDENSEISLVVKENNIGWSYSSSESLLDFFNNIDGSFFELSANLGLKARDIAVNKYSKSLILSKFKDLLC
jgi:glycosyltransferase involved in cell wall biosynthesis